MNKIIQGDCLEKLKELEDNSVDAVVTDPPYGLSFMGKKWDYDVPSQEIWKECLRVLKPGGYLLSFAGTRTQHRMAVRIEDAGFEIRDMIAWVYGSGFPKSLNIGKAVDKLGGRCLGEEIGNIIKTKRIELGYSTIKLAEIGGFYGNTNHGGTVSNWETGRGSITPEQFNKLIEILGLENEPVIATERELLGKSKFGASSIYGSEIYNNRENGKEIDITKGTSEWEGWGTALKPALEPITVARKPLSEKTVAENVLKWGTGGINIDGSRVGTEVMNNAPAGNKAGGNSLNMSAVGMPQDADGTTATGRFPANLIHDGSDEVVGLFPNSSKGWGKATNSENSKDNSMFGIGGVNANRYDMGGTSASRFFYCAKASKSERNRGCEGLEEKQKVFNGQSSEESVDMKGVEQKFTTQPAKNFHPTVKPIALMEYLVKLVSREGAVVLDPFAGSGSTLLACKNLNRQYIGIEREEDYIKIINARLQ
jgi:DNA modification methylase